MNGHLIVSDNGLTGNTCGFVGTYGSKNLYFPGPECIYQTQFTGNDRLLDVPEGTTSLIWISDIALEDEILASVRAENPWDYLEEAVSGVSIIGEQHVFGVEPMGKTIYRSSDSALLAVSDEAMLSTLSTLLQPFHKAYAISYPPSPLLPVPEDDVRRVQWILSELKFNSDIAHLVHSISISQMHEDITYLTGESPNSPIESRHSFHPHSRLAAKYLLDQVSSTGASCELRPFLTGFAPNVICRYNGTVESDELVLLSAHYDSRGSFGSTRAPGGDDDGSGTTAILSIARAIGRSGITFKSNVELCLFAGEEQGLLGSRAYAKELREADANITLMIQADMLAYRKPGEPMQLGLPDLIGTPEVAYLVTNISSLYSPELEVGLTPACCSDHQSFHQQGFAATQVFERAGPIADPMYHNSGDLSNREGYDFRQLKGIAKVQVRLLLILIIYETD